MFILSKLAIAVISPLGSALLGGVVAVVLALCRCRRWALVLGILSVAWLWVWSLPVASYALRDYLESQNPPVAMAALPKAEAIVVLGGGVWPLRFDQRYPNLSPAADREWQGARLYQAGKAPLVVLSGGHDARFSAGSSAAAMRQFITALGVPESAILLEPNSRNTTQNARFTAEVLADQGVRRILLVTSALHMPRAASLFEAQGFEVIPAATDYEVRREPQWFLWTPNTDALDGSRRAIKEIVGKLVGR